MVNEKERVLEMVADGTITASEGVKLLEALGPTASGPDKSRQAKKKRIIDTRAMINEIGPMIQATMGDVFKGRKSMEAFDNVTMEEVESVSEEVQEGQILVIHGDMGRGENISVSLERSEDNILSAFSDNNSLLKTGARDNRKIIMWKSGKLSVRVPDIMGSVKVLTRGGGISSSGVRIPLDLKTMGGGIDIAKPGDKFSIKTMGGGLNISIDSTWKGNSKAKTMGGGISIQLADDVAVLVKASTLGGSISAGGKNPEIVSKSGRGHGKSSMSVRYGEEESSPVLSVTSMGGGIVINGEVDE